MYPLKPASVFVLDRVLERPECLSRMERMLAAIGFDPDRVTVYSERNLPETVSAILDAPPPTSSPGVPAPYARPLVFTLAETAASPPDISGLAGRGGPGSDPGVVGKLMGRLTLAVDQHPHALDQRNNCVCWPTWNFGTVSGCSHGCLYCSHGRSGKMLVIALNLEEYMDRVVRPVIEANPWSRVFRMILNGDPMTLEPEYGVHELFARVLADYPDRWGYFHTNGTNVDWLAGMPHRDRLVGVWSVTCEKVAEMVEEGAGSARERFEAAARCREMGIPVRLKFKPVIPVRDWRAEYAAAVRQAVEIAKPESIGFALYMWNSFETMISALGEEMLDPECLAGARRAQKEMEGVRTGPFPHETRREIYRFLVSEARRRDASIPLYLSTESREMWDELRDELGQDPGRYICGCGSVAVPGRRLALSPAFRRSTYHSSPL